MYLGPPSSTLTATLFPYTTLFRSRSPSLHWHDEETRAFVEFCFDVPQRRALTRLAYFIDRRRRRRPSEQRRVALDAISIALSRLIVTKEQGASLARDKIGRAHV